jgi:hypothetical protein
LSWRPVSELAVPARLLTATQICDLSVFANRNTLLSAIRITKI